MFQQTTFYTEREWYTSLLTGHDNEVLDRLIQLHAVRDPYILDCSYSQGTMWNGCQYKPHVKSDILALHQTSLTADWNHIPVVDNSFDVIVFDPPHLPTAAATEFTSLTWEWRYGITKTGAGREGENVIGMFLPFLLEAKRVLRYDGIILAKIADLVHNHRYQWQQVAFINLCCEAGLVPCDMLIKGDPAAGNLKSSKWETQYHLRKAHCYWIVVRNSSKCEPSWNGKT